MQWCLCTFHFSTSHETSNLNRDHLLEYKHHQSTKIIKISSWHTFFVWFLLGILSHSTLSSLPSKNAKVNGQFHSLQRGKCESRELQTRTFACFTEHSWEHNPSLSIYRSLIQSALSHLDRHSFLFLVNVSSNIMVTCKEEVILINFL